MQLGQGTTYPSPNTPVPWHIQSSEVSVALGGGDERDLDGSRAMEHVPFAEGLWTDRSFRGIKNHSLIRKPNLHRRSALNQMLFAAFHDAVVWAYQPSAVQRRP